MLGAAIGLLGVTVVLALFAGPWFEFQRNSMSQILGASIPALFLRVVDLVVGAISLAGAILVFVLWLGNP